MKINKILIAILFISVNSYGQKIIHDKIDPFTKSHLISTDLSPLLSVGKVNGVQVFGTLEKLDTSVNITLSFYSDDIGIVESVPGERVCYLKLSDNTIITGKWKNTTQIEDKFIGKVIFSTYLFNSEDLKKMINHTVTEIKISGDKGHKLQFEVTVKNRNNLSKISKLLLSKI